MVEKVLVPNFEDEEVEIERRPSDLEMFESELSALLESMKNKLESNTYDLVIGVDSSGRLPAFAIDQALKLMHPDNHRHVVMHISSKRNMSGYDEILYKNDIEKKFVGIPEGQNVLVVDDTIGSGKALSRIVRFLKQKNCNVDVAALCVLDQFERNYQDDAYVQNSIQLASAKVGAHIYYGFFGEVSSIYNKPYYSGVTKPAQFADSMLDSHFLPKREDFFESRKVALDTVKKFLHI